MLSGNFYFGLTFDEFHIRDFMLNVLIKRIVL